MLPASLKESAEEALRQKAGDPGPILHARSVTGGDIGEAFRLETKENRYFFKYRDKAPAGLFTAERQGLEALARGGGPVRIPTVIDHRGPEQTGVGWILMNWLEPENASSGPDPAEALGQGLAAIHCLSSSSFGWESDNFIGLLPQRNTPHGSWTEFYREQRLRPQMEIARKQNRLPSRRERMLTRLMDRLDRWLDIPSIRPALLHGDLWGGNWMIGPGGLPCLIDPAVYYGHGEVDLAFSELFGGFPTRFYDAYREICPALPGYEDRKPLYQLYYLLVHLNLFGETYGSEVDRVLMRYAG
ncbi:fructosamine-3-kinase [Melghirimyces profundicolus]|uniref:Fructosamine-3-kinase n=1 Tax=Melghirimyces profundicolus TaxID=1242148 RepID=A0A2T6BGU6_9BACL|nr:fructosamine kinase family protein [Melghirimyces profundicolus]PTX55295.1 fructosamine-3-kinase [Melghirimyces profundicolus]